jgi:hypothetical protein
MAWHLRGPIRNERFPRDSIGFGSSHASADME